MSPTARSLQALRSRGACAEVVEQFIRITGKPGQSPRSFRRDLFGFGDILAIEPDHTGALIVQACITSDQADRLAKITAESRARLWLEAGNRIQVMAWAKRGGRGERKVWTPSVTHVTLWMMRMTPEARPRVRPRGVAQALGLGDAERGG